MAALGNSLARLYANRSLFAGLSLLLLIVLVALIGPLLIDPALSRVGATIPRLPPSADHWFGTDGQGRDMFTTMILALPQTLRIGIAAGFISLFVGVALGLIAGFVGGVVDTIIRVASDVMMTIPGIAILVLVGFRLALRLTAGAPSPQTSGTPIFDRLAHAVHWLFYALLVAMPVTGLLAYYVSPEIGEVHEIGKPLFILLIAVHVAGALYHQFLLKDGTLRRMLVPRG